MVGLAGGSRTQAKDNTVRLVVLRELEVVQELDPDPTADELLSAEEYLQDRGYLALAGIELTRGAYTITPAGLTWLDGGLQESPRVPESVTEEQREPGGALLPGYQVHSESS